MYNLRSSTLIIIVGLTMALSACVKDKSTDITVTNSAALQAVPSLDSNFVRFPTLLSLNNPAGTYDSNALGSLPDYLYKSDPLVSEVIGGSIYVRMIVNQKTFVYFRSRADPVLATINYTAAMWNSRKASNADFLLPVIIDATDKNNTSQLLASFKIKQAGGTYPIISMEFFLDAIDDHGTKFVAVYKGNDGYVGSRMIYDPYNFDKIHGLNAKFSAVLKLTQLPVGIVWTGPKTIKIAGNCLSLPVQTIIQ